MASRVALSVNDDRDHLVARADAERAQRQVERGGAAAQRDALVALAVGRVLLLERLDLRAAHEPAGVDDAAQRLVQLGAHGVVLASQVDHRDLRRGHQ